MVMAAILLYLGADFVQQANASRQRQEELDRLERRIAAARQEQESLKELLTYVQSPEAAEAWARDVGWAQPDEVSVVLVAPPADTSLDVESQEAAEAKPDSYRASWWDLFFGER
jgi:hypothetical protein